MFGKTQTTNTTKPTQKKPQATAAKNSASAGKRGAQPKKAENNDSTKQTTPPKRKNVSQTIPNGTFVITNDKYFYGSDGGSDKTRMSTVVDSNRKNEVALVKYTTSEKHGRQIENSKGFKGHADKVYTLDNENKPIKLDNEKFIAPEDQKRKISSAQANEIKRRNIKESRYKAGNLKNLQNLKGRKRKKNKKIRANQVRPSQSRPT